MNDEDFAKTLETFKDGRGHLIKFSGHNEREVHTRDFVSLVKDIFDVGLYGRFLPESPKEVRTRNIISNESFWHDAINGTLREGMSVILSDFHLIEWIPISPGRFFTREAAMARKEALRYVYGDKEFLPLGKSQMIFGGIGSVRLKSRIINDDRSYFVGATSSGVSHEGIPLLVRQDDFDALVGPLADKGGVKCDVTGWVRILPDELSLIGSTDKENWGPESGMSTPLPKFCIEVKKIRECRTSEKGELLSTAAVMFPTEYYRGRSDSRADSTFSLGGYETYYKKSWSFCSFDPSDGISGIKSAANWLQDYAGRYSNDPDGDEESQDLVPIFSDFDEHIDHFPNKVEFPLQEIRSGRIDIARLAEYRKFYGFAVNVHAKNIIMGDQIEQNIHGGTFYGPVAAKMEQCTTIIGQQPNDQRKELLAKLQKEVTGLIQRLPDNQREDAVDNLKLLVESATAKVPRRQWYEVSSRGLLDASKFVKDFTGNIVGTIGQLGKLLWPNFELPGSESK